MMTSLQVLRLRRRHATPLLDREFFGDLFTVHWNHGRRPHCDCIKDQNRQRPFLSGDVFRWLCSALEHF